MEWTKAQEEQFWKWCGFTTNRKPRERYDHWFEPDGHETSGYLGWGHIPAIHDVAALLKWVPRKLLSEDFGLEIAYPNHTAPLWNVTVRGMADWETGILAGKPMASKNESLAAAIVEAVWPQVGGKDGLD